MALRVLVNSLATFRPLHSGDSATVREHCGTCANNGLSSLARTEPSIFAHAQIPLKAASSGRFLRRNHPTALLHLGFHRLTVALTHVHENQSKRGTVYSRNGAFEYRRCRRTRLSQRFPAISRADAEWNELSQMWNGYAYFDTPPLAVAQLIDNGWRSKSRSGPASEASKRAPAFRRADRAPFWLWPPDRSVTPVPKGCSDRPDR